MGRPQRYDEVEILEGAKHVSAERGPQKLTIAKVAQRTGVPVGSIYHRYASRDEILAALWLDLAEEFQEYWLVELDREDVLGAGLAGVRYACRWIGRHPREARLLLLHRREDFASERWPAGYRRRAERLASRAAASLSTYAARLTGRGGAAEVRMVRFALIDLPTAALRRDIEAGAPPSEKGQRLLLQTCAYVLRHAARSQSKGHARR
jgi:AcrR family transcriptional regulator